MNDRPRILFTATFHSSFIRTDREILERQYPVNAVISSGIGMLLRLVRNIFSADVTYSWFASVYSSFLIVCARMLGKRTVLILGGVDVACEPALNYGLWTSRWRSILARYAIRHADVVLAVDPSIKAEAMERALYNGKNITVLPTGHDPSQWTPGTEERQQVILTVAACDTMTRFRIKGIDHLFAVAAAMPAARFILVGLSGTLRTKVTPPPNVEIRPLLQPAELLALYRSSAVYFQPSYREALGSALCEAMLCGCTPVGTNVGGIPTVIGDTGTLVLYGDVPAAVSALNGALQRPQSLSARERIISRFSLAQREAGIISVIRSLHERR